MRLEGGFDQPAFEAALMDVVARHESLRTVFAEIDGIPHQKILPVEAAQLTVERLEVSEAELPQALKRAAGTCFNLDQEVPLRAWLFHVDEKRQVLLLLLNHIAGDGWSFTPLVRDLTTAYAARRQGQSPAWSPLPVQYADYMLWQRQLLGEEADPNSPISRQIAYWKETLAGLPDQAARLADGSAPVLRWPLTTATPSLFQNQAQLAPRLAQARAGEPGNLVHGPANRSRHPAHPPGGRH